MHTGPPDFVGLGAQKSGTTWWYMLLSRHPEVFVPRFRNEDYPDSFTKERHFFDPFFQATFEERHVEIYHKWFPRPQGMCTGEWTPRYLVDFWAAPLLARAAPQAKLLVLLRDPIHRFPSGLAQRQRNHQLRSDDAVSHHHRGLYAHQLRTWFDYFPRDRFLILQYEKCAQDPESELRKTFRFLGLEDMDLPERLFEKQVNTRQDHTKYTAPAYLRETQAKRYADDIRDLKALVPDLDLSLWPNFSHLS
jgi:hypothetical protein